MDLHLTITNSAKRDHPSSCTRASWRENLHPFHGIPFHLSTSQLFNPTRSTIQFRSYRANFPSPEYDSTRTLTSIVYSHASEQGRGSSPVVKDDTAYLFLEDRMGSVSTLSNTVDIVSSSKSLDEDGFEIVEAPLATLAPSSSGPPRTPPSHPQPQSQSQTHQEPSTQPQTAAQPESQIQTISHPLLAVRPATNVTQLLHSLLSGFVLGMTKSARATASTTSQLPEPTPLPGNQFLLTSLIFQPLPRPNPPLVLTVHILPNPTAPTIFLEAEYSGLANSAVAKSVLREFLDSCLPERVEGEKFYLPSESPESGDQRAKGREGIERTRRSTTLLVRRLREAGISYTRWTS
ncbi:MAG: hypothetical protein TREMPRED_003253 [Tremellales sp. Tagirdzhanova-0007]|nr:MAG: hypothetical protein TREMPRED_003253 [Tremellales sp. Tagirdzhanova-0007]